MSDNPKEAEKQMEKAITKLNFISGDAFLAVFKLLPPRQLGLGIALISRRFDYYVDEHFKTRRWSLGEMRIKSKIGENGATEMEIFNENGESLPIPKEPMPKKVIGFKCLFISYIDRNVVEFLRRFSSLFANCEINLVFFSYNDHLLQFVVRNIWPLLKDGIRGLEFSADFDFGCLRYFGSLSILSDCPSLRFVFSFANILPKLPEHDSVNALDGQVVDNWLLPEHESANALDGQVVDKWLFSPRPDGVPKVLGCNVYFDQYKWSSEIKGLKVAFNMLHPVPISSLSFGLILATLCRSN